MSNPSNFLSFLFFFSILLICFTIQAETDVDTVRQNETTLVDIGAVLDLKSPMDGMVNVCLSMALSEFYARHSNYRTKLSLHTRDSSNDLIDTASSGN